MAATVAVIKRAHRRGTVILIGVKDAVAVGAGIVGIVIQVPVTVLQRKIRGVISSIIISREVITVVRSVVNGWVFIIHHRTVRRVPGIPRIIPV